MGMQALTMNQLRVFNINRPFKLRCKVLGHKLAPVDKPLPIRQNGRIVRHQLDRCLRCGHAELKGRV